MKHIVAFFQFISVLPLIFLTGCDRAKKLQEERQKVDMEAESVHSQTQKLEQHIIALGADSVSLTFRIEREASMLEQKATSLLAEIDSIKAKLSTLETAIAKMGPKVDIYKSKHLR